MRSNYMVWIVLWIVAALLTLTTRYYAYFPGDVPIEKWVQSLVPQNLNWAGSVSRTAEFPWVLFVLVVIFVFSWVLAGSRSAIISIFSFVGMLALGNWLGLVIARPRPTPELVRVYRHLSGYSFPSLFALRYASTFGFLAILAIRKSSGFHGNCAPGPSLLIGDREPGHLSIGRPSVTVTL
jgi:hypothetical protein